MARKDRSAFDEPEEEIIYVSKSELKRDMQALQELGKNIVNLSDGQLATIPIDDDTLAEAIQTARRIKSREGLRRQMQYIGKLLRKIDTEAMAAAYQKLLDGRKEDARQFHLLEQQRDQLIADGPAAVETVIDKHPHADRQQLRQLVMQANKEKKQNKPPAAARKLFRYLKELSDG